MTVALELVLLGRRAVVSFRLGAARRNFIEEGVAFDKLVGFFSETNLLYLL